MLAENTLAPDFELEDQSGVKRKLSSYLGHWLLLYFYPKDDTPGCTEEACTIRDNWQAFEKAGITVLGVSADSTDSHQKFATKYSLPFTLLADDDRRVIKLYQAGDQIIRRVSYLINPSGEIAKAYSKVVPSEHSAQVLRDIVILNPDIH